MLRLTLILLLVVGIGGCAGGGSVPPVLENADRDGDGIPNTEDRCPDSAPEARVGADGCAPDKDLDGVSDYLDRCPGTSAGLPVDQAGCPLDEDDDGVPDGQDKCPGTRAATRIDGNGCPVPKTSSPARKKALKIELQIKFQTGSSTLLESNDAQFARGIDFIGKHPGCRIIVEGHTDSVGPADYNRTLSRQRAAVVGRELARRLGPEAPEMELVGIGEEQPLGDNASQEGRARNRRVTIRIATQ